MTICPKCKNDYIPQYETIENEWVIYFRKLEYESAEYDIYEYGIGQRKDKHDMLIDTIDIEHLTYKQGFDLGTDIRAICQRLDIYYPYKNSNETCRIRKTDDINVVINYAKDLSKKINKIYLPDIIMANPPYRKESPRAYKQRLESIKGEPIKIKTFNYVMIDSDYDDLVIV